MGQRVVALDHLLVGECAELFERGLINAFAWRGGTFAVPGFCEQRYKYLMGYVHGAFVVAFNDGDTAAVFGPAFRFQASSSSGVSTGKV